MQEGTERQNNLEESTEEKTRPQQGGEAATTRFGMEDGDNTDVPATGVPNPDEKAPEGST